MDDFDETTLQNKNKRRKYKIEGNEHSTLFIE